MDPQTWRRVRAIFDELIDTPPQEWAQRLSALGVDDALGAEVLALLNADLAQLLRTAVHAQAPQMLAELADADRDAQYQVLEGLRVGAFRLLRELGRGGMGTVWLAERIDGEFSQQVAVKLIRPGWNPDEVLARFRAERQILAGLTHPNIAHLIDGGVSADGRPWLALEYVDGIDLRQYCDRNHLSLGARMQLFLTVCDAVSHAHAHLVVHRDLKPSNLLVTAAGEVKLLDFGIAKLLAAPAAEVSSVRMFTPEYAAPEQVRGEAVTVAVDVYALGLLLYELLTGRRPYKAENSTPAAYERAILDQEPTRPSIAVTRDGDDADAHLLAAQRELRPEQLRRELRGDLDAIVLKALRKDPAQRYASVADLAADVRNHQQHLPVVARRGGWRYRAGRFLSRHALAMALALAAVLALIGGLGIALWQAKIARQEAAKSQATLNFMLDVFKASGTARSNGREVKAADLLDAAILRVRHEVTEPEARSALLLAIITAYRSLNLGADTLPLVDEAVRVARSNGNSLPLAQALLLHAAAMHDARRYPDVLRDIDEAEALLKGNSAPEDELRMRFAQARSNALISLDRPEEAEAALADLYALQRDRLGELAELTMNTVIYRAAALYNLDKPEQARALLEPILVKLRNAKPPQEEYYANFAGMLAYSFEDSDLPRAIALNREKVQIYERVYGPNDTNTATALNSLARNLMGAAQYDEAKPVAERGLTAYRTQADDPTGAFGYLRTLGEIELRRGEFAHAESLLTEAIALREQKPSENNSALAYVYTLRGSARHRLLRDDEVRADFDRADALADNAKLSALAAADLGSARLLVELLADEAPSNCARADNILQRLHASAHAQGNTAQFSAALAAACAWRLNPSPTSAQDYRDKANRVRSIFPPQDYRIGFLDDFDRFMASR